jgi:hypothetical protein
MNATVVSAHTAGQIISVVTVETADRSAAVAVALAVMSEALRRPVASPSPRPCSAASRAGSQMHGSYEIFCGIPGASECPYGQCSGLWAKSGAGIRCSCPELRVSVSGKHPLSPHGRR